MSEKTNAYGASVRRRMKRKTCPGCGQNLSARYFRDHQAQNYLDGVWKCQCAQEDVSRNEDMGNAATESDTDLENDSMPNTTLRNDLRHSVRKYLRKGIIEDEFQEGDEIWENATVNDIDFDLTDTQSDDNDNVDFAPHDHQHIIIFTICLFICLWQSAFILPDNAIVSLLTFLQETLSIVCDSHPLFHSIPVIFPATLYMLWKTLGFKEDNFNKFVICRKCFSLYKYDSCVGIDGGEAFSKTCPFVAFPYHTQPARRTRCGELLLKTVRLPSGKTRLYPFKVFCFKSIKESFQRLVRRPGFETECDRWKTRNHRDGYYTDVYDGRIWKEFQSDAYRGFLRHPNTYGIMLNLDWFQPFDHVQYSVGVIYAVVLNLPREERFKIHNVILIGLIPDMGSEPKVDSFIRPLVDELLTFWNTGFPMKTYKSPTAPVDVRVALMCVGCDIPAARKLCGFLGHMATLGCSRCFKRFEGDIASGGKNYAGFDRCMWTKRSLAQHRENLAKVQAARTQTERQEIESKLGLRSSDLNRLPYFDPIRMTTIDPMHNLYQGTAKRMMKIWTSLNIIDAESFKHLQEKVDIVEAPSTIGRLPRKIAASFGGFTAEQWKTWTNVFSIYALKGIISDRYVSHWRFFVLASILICSRILLDSDIELIDQYLIAFCQGFEQLYGKDQVTPNMHLHCHLVECLLDFGPAHAFWLFSFERYNGYLGFFPTNNRSVEIQFMRRFMRDILVRTVELPVEMVDKFSSIANLKEKRVLCLSREDRQKLFEISRPGNALSSQSWDDIGCYSCKSVTTYMLKEHEYVNLRRTYQRLYPNWDINSCCIPQSCRKIGALVIGNEVIGTSGSRYKRSCIIMACWSAGGGNVVEDGSDDLRPGIIDKIISHNIIRNGQSNVHLFAFVSWYLDIGNLQSFCGKPVGVWSRQTDNTGPASIMPVQRILCKCIQANGKIKNKNVLFVSPTSKYLHIE